MVNRTKPKGNRKKKQEMKDETKPCCNSHARNDSSWYNRFSVPFIGVNWAHLSRTGPDSTARGQIMNTHITIPCEVGVPADKDSAFMRSMSDLYAELRESNTGAAAYTAQDLACYVTQLMAAEIELVDLIRGFKMAEMKNELFVDSPWIFTALAGWDNYTDIVSNLANWKNQLAIMIKDIEQFPLLPIALRERNKYFMGSVFVDSECSRPSTYAFVPANINYITYSGGTLSLTAYLVWTNTYTQRMASARNHIDVVMGNTTNHFDIIRGDLIKAFGNDAFHWDLMDRFLGQPQIVYNKNTLDQICNMTHLERDAGSSVTRTINSNGKVEFTVTGCDSRISSWFDGSAVILNTREPNVEGADLLELTRLYHVIESGSKITHTSGIIPLEMKYIYSVTATSCSRQNIRTAMSDIGSTIQSTAMDGLRKCASIAMLCDYFPVIPTDTSHSTYEMFWDITEYTTSSQQEMEALTAIANRSLCMIHLPRKADGRIDKGGR